MAPKTETAVPGTPFVVLADPPDDRPQLAIDVEDLDAVLPLVNEIVNAGWKPAGVRQRVTVEEFRRQITPPKWGVGGHGA